MDSMLRSSNEKEIERILDYIPGIIEEAKDISSFYKSQARINGIYRRAKGISKTTYMNKYSSEFIENEFGKSREELDKIYYKIVGD